MNTYSSPLRYDQGVSRANANASPADWVSLVGRLALAALFLWSGFGKLVYMDGNIAYMKAFGLPAAGLLIWATLLLELLGGAMLAIGWKARFAAVVLAAFTIVATFLFHAYWSLC